MERIVSFAAEQDVVSACAGDHIVSGFTVEVVVLRPSLDHVAALTAEEHVAARIAVQPVGAVSAVDVVVAVASVDCVVARASEQVVGTALAPDPVVARPPFDVVVSLVCNGHPCGIAFQDVVTGIPGDEIVARLPEDRVITLSAVYLVAAASGVDEIIPRACVNRVVARGVARLEGQAVEVDAHALRDGEGPVAHGKPVVVVSEYGVVPAAAHDQIVTVKAHERVAAVGSVNKVVPETARDEVALACLAQRDFTGLDEACHLAVDLAEEQIVAGPAREQVCSRSALQHVVAAHRPVGVQDVAPLAADEPVVAALRGVDVVVAGKALDKIIALAVGLDVVGCG
ncbi:MAG: hypothetical protein A4E67_00221 [Syntrophaceae bacterium PtaB.Bin038]|nr:MAG: hypothetical protein A4E67_00221 [Syntrophaceae bacterium PtaB.Bin038]